MVALTYGQRPPKPQNPRGRSWGRKRWPLDPPVAHFEDRGTLNIQMLCTRPEHERDHVWHAPFKAMGDWGGSCVPAVVAYFGKAAKNVVDPALVIPLLLEARHALAKCRKRDEHAVSLQIDVSFRRAEIRSSGLIMSALREIECEMLNNLPAHYGGWAR